MLSPLLATCPKCSAFQSTTIFRLPTPRKPPESMTAARTTPARSTMTSTMRPMSSSAALRTSRRSTPCASLAPMMVTEGGGAGSFGAAGGAVFCGWGGGGELCSAGGVAGFSSAQDAAATEIANATATNANRGLGRIRPPEVLDPKGHQSSNAAQALREGQIIAPARSTPESGHASATLPVTHRRRGGEHRDQRLKARAADRAAPLG